MLHDLFVTATVTLIVLAPMLYGYWYDVRQARLAEG